MECGDAPSFQNLFQEIFRAIIESLRFDMRKERRRNLNTDKFCLISNVMLARQRTQFFSHNFIDNLIDEERSYPSDKGRCVPSRISRPLSYPNINESALTHLVSSASFYFGDDFVKKSSDSQHHFNLHTGIEKKKAFIATKEDIEDCFSFAFFPQLPCPQKTSS